MKNPGDFILTLFNARTVAHVLHLQTTSYAKHQALGNFYDNVVFLADKFAESYQGCYGIIEFKGASYKLEKDPLKMLTDLKAVVAAAHAECSETHLQNILDEISALISSTMYKIKNLA